MYIGNRFEVIPQLLGYIDLVLLLLIVPIAAVTGSKMFLFAVFIPVIAYALGAYDLLPATRRSSLNAHHYATLLVCICLAIYKIPAIGMSTPAVALPLMGFAAAAIGISLIRRMITISLLRGAQRVTLRLPQNLEHLRETFVDFIASAGYPAQVVAGEKTPVVQMSSLHRMFPDEPESVEMKFDPVAFLNCTAKALPPELLSIYPDYFDLRLEPSVGYLFAKRVVDVALSLILLVLTLPLWAFAAVGILIFDGPGVFFVQTRVGQNGQRFNLLKFRTLRPIRPVNIPTENLEQRKFAFGTLLRKMRIDEFPQLLQVIFGQMALVGPRPEMVYYHERSVAQIPFYECRLHTKPGVTGWAQVRFPHTTAEDEYLMKTAYDLWYVVNRSFFLDLRIVLRTFGVLLQRFGSK
jgi:lipopolysaccharide/colanic/teichoic acid biosynthesis glycosyltransferase